MGHTHIYAQLAQGYTLVVDYRYDPLYRLVEATASDGAYYAFRYDAVGNRLAYTSTTGAVRQTTYTYDAADRLRVVKQGGFDTVYGVERPGGTALGWGAVLRVGHRRPVGVSGPGGLEVGYARNEAGNRVEKTVNRAIGILHLRAGSASRGGLEPPTY